MRRVTTPETRIRALRWIWRRSRRESSIGRWEMRTYISEWILKNDVRSLKKAGNGERRKVKEH